MLNTEFLFVEWMNFFQFLFLLLTVTVTVWQSQSDNDLNYCIWSGLLLDILSWTAADSKLSILDFQLVIVVTEVRIWA